MPIGPQTHRLTVNLPAGTAAVVALLGLGRLAHHVRMDCPHSRRHYHVVRDGRAEGRAWQRWNVAWEEIAKRARLDGVAGSMSARLTCPGQQTRG